MFSPFMPSSNDRLPVLSYSSTPNASIPHSFYNQSISIHIQVHIANIASEQGLCFLLVFALLMVGLAGRVSAVGGAYSIRFFAADPAVNDQNVRQQSCCWRYGAECHG